MTLRNTRCFRFVYFMFFFEKISLIIRIFISLILFPIKNRNRISSKDLNQIIDSEVFSYFRTWNPTTMDSRGYFRREWTRLAWLAMQGDLQNAIKGREALIQEARTLQGLSETYIPMILERSWTTHYGHLGCLINFRNAQNLGLVPSERRLVLRSTTFAKHRPIYRLIENDFEFLNSNSKETIFDIEPFFAVTEKVSFVYTPSGFLDLSQILNVVGEKKRNLGRSQRERLPALQREYDYFYKILRRFGLTPHQSFVGLHIRDTRDKYSSRDSSVINFVPAIKEITSRGRIVVRIGSRSSPALPDIPGLIDIRELLTDENDFMNDLVISDSEFFVTSQSGPAAVAHVLGVPTLVVDGVAPARWTYSTSALSMTLPKSWYDRNGRRLSGESVFGLGLGFCEFNSQDKDYYMKNNSEYELLSAVKEFMEILENPHLEKRHSEELQKLKSEVGGIGSGLISQSFFN